MEFREIILMLDSVLKREETGVAPKKIIESG